MDNGLQPPASPAGAGDTYSVAARHFHWWTVGLLALQIPIGIYMSYRGNILNLFDGLTDDLYSFHKLNGLVLLTLILARLGYRLVHGAPPDEPTIEPWQKVAAHVTHWSLYGLLIVVPMLGWLGVSRYPALEVFGLFSLPALVAPDQDAAARLFTAHGRLALAMTALITLHVGAALFHHVIRRDGVLVRMLPVLRR